MKICKNCGQQTDDGKVRCPHCGFLFEEDMDDVLREMKNNLRNYRSEVVAKAASAAQPESAAPSPSAQQPAPESDAGQKERFELLAEVAQMKGEMRVLQNEIERLHNTQPAQTVVYAPQPAPAAPAAGQDGAGGAPAAEANAQKKSKKKKNKNFVISVKMTKKRSANAQKKSKKKKNKNFVISVKMTKKRSANRIVISILATLFLGLSIGMLFMPWVKDMAVKGYEGLLYIFDKESQDTAGFQALMAAISAHQYANGEFFQNLVVTAITYVVQWGVVVYMACLLLSIFVLFSLGGKIKFRAWHRCWAWLSFVVAAVLFGVFFWTFKFSGLTIWFLLGMGANFVRAILFCFYKKEDYVEGGLQ